MKVIYETVAVEHSMRSESPEGAGSSAQLVGADDFLPILAFVVANSSINDIGVRVAMLEWLGDPSVMMSEPGYYFNSLVATMHHLQHPVALMPRRAPPRSARDLSPLPRPLASSRPARGPAPPRAHPAPLPLPRRPLPGSPKRNQGGDSPAMIPRSPNTPPQHAARSPAGPSSTTILGLIFKLLPRL